MPLENLWDLRVFVRVVEAGSMAEASRGLDVPANTVSRTIARLERDVGAALLLRTTRRMSLTREGQTLYEHGVGLLGAAERAQEALGGGTREGLSGLLRVAVRTTLVQFGFLKELLVLLDAHPELRVQLLVNDREPDFVAEGLDLAIRIGALEDSTLRMRHLGMAHFVLCATPEYLARAGRPERPEDLASHECIRVLHPRPQMVWHLRGPGGARSEAFGPGRFVCDDIRTQREAILAGFGIGVRPIGEVERSDGALVRVLPGWALEPIAVRALLAPRPHMGGRGDAIEEVVRLCQRAVTRMGSLS